MMLDDLRSEAASSALFEEDDTPVIVEDTAGQRQGPFLGMTAGQRLILATMLLFSVCMLGSLCLLVTERVVPPGLY